MRAGSWGIGFLETNAVLFQVVMMSDPYPKMDGTTAMLDLRKV